MVRLTPGPHYGAPACILPLLWLDFIWSDIQGAEADLIKGGRETLSHTDYLYTEYNNGPMYEGCLGLEDILESLLGWSLVEDYDGDALLKNGHGK